MCCITEEAAHCDDDDDEKELQQQMFIVSRPGPGGPRGHNFGLVESAAPRPEDLQAGEVLVRTHLLSVEPWTSSSTVSVSGPQNPIQQHWQDWSVGRPGSGLIVGVVTGSRLGGLAAGDAVLFTGPWQLYSCVPANRCTKLDTAAPLESYLGCSSGRCHFEDGFERIPEALVQTCARKDASKKIVRVPLEGVTLNSHMRSRL